MCNLKQSLYIASLDKDLAWDCKLGVFPNRNSYTLSCSFPAGVNLKFCSTKILHWSPKTKYIFLTNIGYKNKIIFFLWNFVIQLIASVKKSFFEADLIFSSHSIGKRKLVFLKSGNNKMISKKCTNICFIWCYVHWISCFVEVS